MIDKVAANLLTNVPAKNQVSTSKDETFGNYLMEAMEKVNQDQLKAEDLNQKLATGEVKDLHQVMIASQQASLSLSLAVQVRNKVVEAYQEIMRMPL